MLSNKALLVSVGISQWVGRKLDKRATETVETSHTTEKRVGNYTKKLLPGASQLEKVQAIASKIRKYYCSKTMPWMTDGARIISGDIYLEFTNEFRKLKNEFDHAVGEFLVEYPRLQLEARAKLGDLFNDAEYPSVEKLTKLFACEIVFMPMPEVGDFRTGISDFEKETFLKKMSETHAQGVAECFSRLNDVISKALERLQKPDGKFKDSLIENIQDLCALLPALNIGNDASLEETRAKVDAVVSGISPDLCRKSAPDRELAARKLKEIQDTMGAFMGGH